MMGLIAAAGAAGWATLLGTSARLATRGCLAVVLGYVSMLLIVEHPDARDSAFSNYLTWVVLAGAVSFGICLSLAGLRRDAAAPVRKFIHRYSGGGS